MSLQLTLVNGHIYVLMFFVVVLTLSIVIYPVVKEIEKENLDKLNRDLDRLEKKIKDKLLT